MTNFVVAISFADEHKGSEDLENKKNIFYYNDNGKTNNDQHKNEEIESLIDGTRDRPVHTHHNARIKPVLCIAFAILILLMSTVWCFGEDYFKIVSSSISNNNNNNNNNNNENKTKYENITSVENEAEYIDIYQPENISHIILHDTENHSQLACQQAIKGALDNLVPQLQNTTNFCSNIYPNCPCKSTIKPTTRFVSRHGKWERMFRRNKAVASAIETPMDVVLLGDSIIEHLVGTDMNQERDQWIESRNVFNEMFTKRLGGQINGLASGIAGDRCSNLLYRVHFGEIPSSLHVKVWWILIGTNDLGSDHCSEESIVGGNIQIIKEIQKNHPTTPIVINSILPRSRGISIPILQQNDNTSNITPTSVGWPSICKINSMLECYASMTPGVYFFNASNIFLQHQENDWYLKSNLFYDPVHPSALGYQVWGEEIIKQVQKIIMQ